MYHLQHFEDWWSTKEEIDATWKMPFYKIVISKWLQEYATSMNEKSFIVCNGLDFNSFGIITPIQNRKPFNFIMLYHHFNWKGSADGIAAMEIVKQKFLAVSLTLFGIDEAPENLSSWIIYYRKLKDFKKLYNDAAVFLSVSWGEGWAMPAAEAMQCGCAIVITDIGGHRDYGINGTDLLLAPVKDSTGFANIVIFVIENNDRRIQMAKSGNKVIKQFTWRRANA